MKRKGDLFEKVCSIENLRLADEKARKGKKHKRAVRRHDEHREEELANLRQSLLDGTFKTSEYTTMTVHEPKERIIHKLPYYPDRIVHHAIMNVVEQIWVGRFTSDTYANIKGRGIHMCAERLRHALYTDPKGTRYCLKLDIRKYYPSIDHEIMKDEVRRTIKDKRLLALIDGIIDSCDGLPIGNYLSQYLANLYLSRFDHRMKEVHGVQYYFPLCRRHGVPCWNKGRVVEDIGHCEVGDGLFAVGTETELAGVSRGSEGHRLPRVCVFPRLYIAKEKREKEDIQTNCCDTQRLCFGGGVHEVNGFMERVA